MYNVLRDVSLVLLGLMRFDMLTSSPASCKVRNTLSSGLKTTTKGSHFISCVFVVFDQCWTKAKYMVYFVGYGQI